MTACFFLFTGAATVYPSHASGAVVALVDENTGSDAELAAEAFRRLNLGVVVGTRTWGGLLTTSDSFKLVDGSEVSMPQQAVAMTDLADSGVKIANRIENRGVVPDVQVCNAPHDYANDRDPQLEAAVAEALRLWRCGCGAMAVWLMGAQFAALDSGLVSSGGLQGSDWLVLALVPVGAVALAVLTARFTVLASLRKML